MKHLANHESNTQPIIFHDANTLPISFDGSNVQPISFHDSNTQPIIFHDVNTQPISFHDSNMQPVSIQHACHGTELHSSVYDATTPSSAPYVSSVMYMFLVRSTFAPMALYLVVQNTDPTVYIIAYFNICIWQVNEKCTQQRRRVVVLGLIQDILYLDHLKSRNNID